MGAEGWRFICSPGRWILRDPRARPPVKPSLERNDDDSGAAATAGAAGATPTAEAAPTAGPGAAPTAGAATAGAAPTAGGAGPGAAGIGADIVKKADIYYSNIIIISPEYIEHSIHRRL